MLSTLIVVKGRRPEAAQARLARTRRTSILTSAAGLGRAAGVSVRSAYTALARSRTTAATRHPTSAADRGSRIEELRKLVAELS